MTSAISLHRLHRLDDGPFQEDHCFCEVIPLQTPGGTSCYPPPSDCGRWLTCGTPDPDFR